MEEYKLFGRLVRAKRKEVNGNWYYVLVWDEPENNSDKYIVIVYADRDGSKMKYEHPSIMHNDKFDIKVQFAKRKNVFEKYYDGSLHSAVAETINKIVCKVEQKQDEKDEFEKMVTAAFDANKEVHEGIDGMLD